jgi:hypothetical protein
MEVFIWSIGFSIIGMGYFSIGKRRDQPSFMYSGIALMVFPYFIEGLMANIIIGLALALAPFILKKFNTY